MYIDEFSFSNEFAQLIAKSISNDGILSLVNCNNIKSEAFTAALGNKHVIKMLKSF